MGEDVSLYILLCAMYVLEFTASRPLADPTNCDP